MKFKFKKTSLIFFLGILFVSCKESDPLSNVEFGKVKIINFKDELVSRDPLDIVEINDGIYDSIAFLKIGQKNEVKGSLWVNTINKYLKPSNVLNWEI